MSKRFREQDKGIPGVDTWYPTTIKMIQDELGLSPKNDEEETTSKIEFSINDSDAFSSVYSKINKSTEFTYIDNESYYDDTNLSLVYEFTGGSLTLEAKLDIDEYKLEVKR